MSYNAMDDKEIFMHMCSVINGAKQALTIFSAVLANKQDFGELGWGKPYGTKNLMSTTNHDLQISSIIITTIGYPARVHSLDKIQFL